MNLEELSQAQQRGCGILVLRSQTATLDEREALTALVNDIKGRLGQSQRPRRNTGHPHGVVTMADGKRVLHVDEERIRTPDDANKLRGLRVDAIQIYPDDTIRESLKAYLHEEVLAPMLVDIADRKEHPGQRKLREAASIYAQGRQEPDVEYLKRFAHTLESRLHDLERYAHAGELPRALNLSSPSIDNVIECLQGHKSALEALEARLDKIEREDAEGQPETDALVGRIDGRLDRLERSTREAHDKIAATGRQLSGRIEKIEEWMRASTARLNAIEIWKHDTLAKSLEAITETLEKHAQYMQGVPPLTLIREEFEAKLREHRAIFDRQRERIEALNSGFEKMSKELYDHAHTLLDRTHCISTPCIVADSAEQRAKREADYRAMTPG